ncbi:MAG: hypothetical protein IT566_01560 [Rhodospirillaceae bacterium]|nr:hypothetical protein [Rhodospirillaceae bacterium]
MAMTAESKRTMGWVALAVVVIAVIGLFLMPNRTTTGDSLTTGTPPNVTDTTPSSNMTPPTPAPAAPTAPY